MAHPPPPLTTGAEHEHFTVHHRQVDSGAHTTTQSAPHPNHHTPVGTSGMHTTTIATAHMHENLLLAAALVHGYPTPLSAITATRADKDQSRSATPAEKHLTPCP